MKKYKKQIKYKYTLFILSFLVIFIFKTTNCHAQGTIQIEKEIINQLNQERVEKKLNTLRFNPILRKAAQIKVEDMIKQNYFSHKSPQGVRAWDILKNLGYDYKFAGENLAMKFIDAHEVHQAWMNSKSHRENILFKDYTEVGVFVEQNEDGELVAAEYFGRPLTTFVSSESDTQLDKNSHNTISYEKILKQQAVMTDYKEPSFIADNIKTKIITEKSSEITSPQIINKDILINFGNLVILLLGVISLVLIVNIWVLEKEDEIIIKGIKRESCRV